MKKREYMCPKCKKLINNISENSEEVRCIDCNLEAVFVPHAGGQKPRDIALDKATKLPPDWQELITKLASEGCTDVEIRAAFMKYNGLKDSNVRAMVKALEENDEEFSAALKNARVLCESWWIEQPRLHKYHSKDMTFETAAWFIVMKNKFGWRDKTEIEHSAPDNLLEKFANLGVEQLKEKIAGLIGKS